MRSVFQEMKCHVCGTSGWLSPEDAAAYTLAQMGEPEPLRFRPLTGKRFDLLIIDDPIREDGNGDAG